MRKLKLKTEEEDVIRIDEIDLSRHLVVLTRGSAKYILCNNTYINRLECTAASKRYVFNWILTDVGTNPGRMEVINAESVANAIGKVKDDYTIDIYEL